MSDDHAMPVTPEVGDEVTVRYKSRRSRDGTGYNERERSGTVERTDSYREAGRRGHAFLIREDPTTYLTLSVEPGGGGGYVYSVNYDEDNAEELRIDNFAVDASGTWTLAWANAEKTRRVTLGKLVEIRLSSVG